SSMVSSRSSGRLAASSPGRWIKTISSTTTRVVLMIASPLSQTCRSSPSSDCAAQSPDTVSGDVIFNLVISCYFKYHLFKSILFGIAHDGSATASNFTGTPGANRVYHRRESDRTFRDLPCYRAAGHQQAG